MRSYALAARSGDLSSCCAISATRLYSRIFSRASGQRRPATLTLVQPDRRLQRLAVGGRAREPAFQDGDRLARVAQAIGGELGHLAHFGALLLGPFEPPQLFALEIEQRPPRAPL